MPTEIKPLTTEQARTFLEHPCINFTAIADRFYGDGRKHARQALRRRVYAVDEISEETGQRLAKVRSEIVREVSRI